MNGGSTSSHTSITVEGLDLDQVDPFIEGTATEGDAQENEIRPIENVTMLRLAVNCCFPSPTSLFPLFSILVFSHSFRDPNTFPSSSFYSPFVVHLLATLLPPPFLYLSSSSISLLPMYRYTPSALYSFLIPFLLLPLTPFVLLALSPVSYYLIIPSPSSFLHPRPCLSLRRSPSDVCSRTTRSAASHTCGS